MAALSFPASPTNGQIFTAGVQTWQWDSAGLAWRLLAVPQVGVGAITSTMILDDTIVNADINSAAAIAISKLASSSAWTSYTPTITGFTGTVPTATGRWMQIGKTVHYNFTLTFGGAPTVTGTPTVSIPATRQGTHFEQCLLAFVPTTASPVIWSGSGTNWASTTALNLEYTSTATVSGVAGLIGVAMSATAPFTFSATSKIYGSGTFEAA
jgi:hypothetical protein